MAVQKSRKTPSKRGMHRSHVGPEAPGAVDRFADRRDAPASLHHAGRFLPRQARDRKSRPGRAKASTASGRSNLRSRIVGTGSYLPAGLLTNFDLEKRMDTSDAWIRERTGIERRHIVSPGETTVDMAEHAARAAMAAAGREPRDVDLISSAPARRI